MNARKPVVITASASLTLDNHAMAFVKADAAAGLTITMPAASGTGNCYDVYFGTTVTSNDYIIQAASASDIFQGAVGVTTDAAGVVVPTAATSDTMTMNGSTTGGLKGSHVRLVDVGSGEWHVSGNLIATGTEATPFSAAV